MTQILSSALTQCVEFAFPRKANISDLSFLIKVFVILILLAILNPEVWIVLLGGLLYFTSHFVRSHISS